MTKVQYFLLCVQVENGLLTPTMKVKRDVVAALYKEQVGALFK
jgi:long-subunit acyl-CoA synthetase (AMP-forming)